MSVRFLRMAVIYALIGVGFGIVMGLSHDFTNRPVHVHANLVGWVSLAIMGMAYHAFPAMAESVLARAHFWLHNLGLPAMLGGIYLIYHGQAGIGDPMAGIGSTVVALGFVAFAINVWLNAGRKEVTQAERSEMQIHAALRGEAA
ncbi:MAG TPA: hypothetical protein PLW86_15040 [Rhodocyclaceae bacterium]|nr:hypothetical protein [Rhodocyclaceae bacterium]